LWSDDVVSMTPKTNEIPTFTGGIRVIYHIFLEAEKKKAALFLTQVVQ